MDKYIMKSLTESLFDKDLIEKDIGLEYLYGYIENARVKPEWMINYLDEKAINHDFNQIMKKFKPQDWYDNRYMSLKKTQATPAGEILRKLLYIIAGNIKFSQLENIEKNVKNIIKKYMIYPAYYTQPRYKSLVDVGDIPYINHKENICSIWFRKLDDMSKIAGIITFKYTLPPLSR